MDIVIPFCYLTAGAILIAAVIAGVVAFSRAGSGVDQLYLTFAALCLTAVGYQMSSGLYHAATSQNNAVTFLRWQLNFASLALPFFFLFIANYTAQKRLQPWLSIVVVAALVFITFNNVMPHTLRLSEPISFTAFRYPWGERVSLLRGGTPLIALLWHITYLTLFIWFLVRAFFASRERTFRPAYLLIVYVVCQLAANYWGYLIDKQDLNGVYLAGFAYTGLVFLMACNLVADLQKQRDQLVESRTDLERAVAQREQAENQFERLSQVFTQSPTPTHFVTLRGDVIKVNHASIRFAGVDLSAAGTNLFDWFRHLGLDVEQLVATLEHGDSVEHGPLLVNEGSRWNGMSFRRTQWLMFKLFPVLSKDNRIDEVVVRIQDVTERQYFDSAIKHIYRGVSSQTGPPFFITLVTNLSQLLGARYAYIALLEEQDGQWVSARTLALVGDGRLLDNFSYSLAGTPCATIIGEQPTAIPSRVQERFPDGAVLRTMGAESYVGAPFLDENGVPVGLLVVLDDKPLSYAQHIQELMSIFAGRAGVELQRLRAEESVRCMAFEDDLTHLPNRARLHEYLGECLRQCREGAEDKLCLVLDLDHFKNINDALGHDVGDDLIRVLAKRLTEDCRGRCFVARAGGDEFVVVVDLPPAGKAEFARQMAMQLKDTIEMPVMMRDHRLHVGCTSGGVIFPDHATTIIDIVRSAEMALYQAKAEGRGLFKLFVPRMRRQAEKRLALERDLRRAIEAKQFVLHYQPQVDARGRVRGAEALIRWQHPEQGLIPPLVFIPLAEETGLINRMGGWVMQCGLALLRDHALELDCFGSRLSINVSPWQFMQRDFIDSTLAVVESSGVLPQRLTLELTETALLTDIEEARVKLARLREYGIAVALDDFGTGYSSLAYLRDLPLDAIKIDKAFVDALAQSDRQPLLEAMIDIGRHMGLAVVAEGVETVEQYDRLKAMGCDFFQGYYFSRPLEEKSLFVFLRDRVATGT